MKEDESSLQKQAWLDEQLSVEEHIKFEEKLGSSEKYDLEKERDFETAFTKKLKDDTPDCPDELWQRLKGQIETGKISNQKDPIPFQLTKRLIAIAALVIFSSVIVFIFSNEKPKPVMEFADNISFKNWNKQIASLKLVG